MPNRDVGEMINDLMITMKAGLHAGDLTMTVWFVASLLVALGLSVWLQWKLVQGTDALTEWLRTAVPARARRLGMVTRRIRARAAANPLTWMVATNLAVTVVVLGWLVF